MIFSPEDCADRVGVNKKDDHCFSTPCTLDYGLTWFEIGEAQQSSAYRYMDVKHELPLCIYAR